MQETFELAVAHHRAGRLAEAEGLYRRMLVGEPNHVEAVHGLGRLAYQVGKPLLALELFGRAIRLSPQDPALHSNFGEALRSMGRYDEAVRAYCEALRLKPDFAEVHNNLGLALAGQGALDDAIAEYRRALVLKPDCAEAENNLGNALSDQGHLAEAADAFGRALRVRPDYAVAYCNFGTVLLAQGKFDESLAALRRAVEIDPGYAHAWNNLGNTLGATGQKAEAAAAFRRTLQLQPDSQEACNNLGVICLQRGQFDEAAAALEHALKLNPNLAAAHMNLGNVLKEEGRLDESISELRRSAQLKPDDPVALSNLVYTLHFHKGWDHRMIAEENLRWSQQFAEPLRKECRPHGNQRDPARRLRIGYVSPDFCSHPISRFVAPLLEAHDRSAVEVHCYASVKSPDQITARLQSLADCWHDVVHLQDVELAERIRADEIDILVDLTQHMAAHRLLTFARKPAPIQISWLGYPATTGLEAMDYRFTDPFLDPVGAAWSEAGETPIRLPHCWFCFEAIAWTEPGPLPAEQSGYVTFGSLNNLAKVDETVLLQWVAILREVENSRLMMHCPAGASQARLRQWFGARGIGAHRLELVSRTVTHGEYLDLYQRIDIGLDPFPYNGGTTTCEALWMGVPVVSLAGPSAVSRLGLSILSNLGVPELATFSEDAYVKAATRLAGDLSRLAELRRGLRDRMRASPLMDGQRFAREIEASYRDVWRRWCLEGRGSKG